MDKLDGFKWLISGKIKQTAQNNETMINMIHHILPPDDADINPFGLFLILYMESLFLDKIY